MLDWVLVIIALATGGGAGADPAEIPQSLTQQAELKAEEQVPTGKFTTAVEVKPILDATRANWIALREFEGQDLLYVTHLFSWRCGLLQMRFAVNGGDLQIWDLPPCLSGTAAPNAIQTEDGLPFRAFELGSVNSVEIEITYDDLSTDSVTFQRSEVLIP